MSKRRTRLKDERLNPKIEGDVHISKFTTIGTREWGLEPQSFDQRPVRNTTIPSDRIFDKSSRIHRVNWRDLSLHLVPVSRSEIKKIFVNEPRKSGWAKASNPTGVRPSDG